jgi:hypothetical protein
MTFLFFSLIIHGDDLRFKHISNVAKRVGRRRLYAEPNRKYGSELVANITEEPI